MGRFYVCKPQCVWKEENFPVLNAVAANTLTAVVSAKGFLPAVFSPSPFQQLQLPSPAVSQLLEALPVNKGV